MPIDKQPRINPQKPITPALSSRFRATARTPIAPRLAGSAPASPAVTARKDPRVGASTEETQIPSFAGNVTPRSGARSSRMGTESPGTPGTLRQPSNTGSGRQGSSISSPAASLGGTRVVASNNSTALTRRMSGTSALSRPDEDDAKFFYAGDVRPTAAFTVTNNQYAPNPPLQVVARVDDAATYSSLTSPATLGDSYLTEKNASFIRANDIPSSQAPRLARPILPKQTSSSSASSFQSRPPEALRQVPAVSPQTSPRRPQKPNRSRPGSPIKNMIASPRTMALPDSPSRRRTSLGSSSERSVQSVNTGRKKSVSVSTVTKANTQGCSAPAKLPRPEVALSLQNVVNPQHTLSGNPISPDIMSPRSASLTSSRTAGTSGTSDTEVSDIAKIILAVKEFQIGEVNGTALKQDPIPIPPISAPLPVPPAAAPQTQAQADATHARRERKVLDLEISNSSLLAINKTLERELRKQSAELRRFRRLSRTGRLSFAPTNRSVSAQSMLSSLSEQVEYDKFGIDSSEDDDDDDAGSGVSNSDEDDQSDANSITARARRRAREERRLMLDLSKHQQLLIDSQKLTQSIRKCLNLTEELIQDGKKALDYKVGIGDIKLGGRVLNNDELIIDAVTHGYQHEEGESRKGLLSPGLTKLDMQEADMWQKDRTFDSGTLGDEQLSPVKLDFVVDVGNVTAKSSPSTTLIEPG